MGRAFQFMCFDTGLGGPHVGHMNEEGCALFIAQIQNRHPTQESKKYLCEYYL